MERRELLKQIALLTGGVFIGGELFLSGGCKSGNDASTVGAFTPEHIAFLDEVAETIIPTTGTPGAKAAQVGTFMTVMVNDCYTTADQKIFKEGISQLDAACEKAHNATFIKATPEQRTSLLTAIDKEAKEYQNNKKKEEPNHYFTMMKQLCLLGYFTSEIGATKALRYVAVPGKYDGNVSYTKGDKAWATS
ncbi:MAG TPA: gluconate 2-dehydrogenase subunit 3 family protein [Phnomibacter sp.]|nr:gluconate 2-dehydrogenase subunit 3 family protein [Phnomibacter sp.]